MANIVISRRYCSDSDGSVYNMKTLVFLLLTVLLQLVTSLPAGPTSDVISLRGRLVRAHQRKTQESSVKGFNSPAAPPPPAAPALDLRKGEYMCGGRVCRLKPDQVPEGCNGMCQYRLG